MEKLVLIDGHAVLHRAYHAFPKSLTTRQGQVINGVYGFARILLGIMEELGPEYLVVTFDRPEPNFRHREFVGYQAQRPKLEAEFKDQLVLVKEMLTALEIPFLEKVGFEADDIIGTLAVWAAGEKEEDEPKLETIIVTGDRDILQLVNERTRVYMPERGGKGAKIFNREKVRETLGIWPEQVVDYKALVGDSSDNYPGVPGIGPKTAVKLLAEFGSWEEVCRQAEKLPKTLKEKFLKGIDCGFLSKKLATIFTQVPLDWDLEKTRVEKFNYERGREYLQKLGFRSLLNRFGRKEKKEDQQMTLI